MCGSPRCAVRVRRGPAPHSTGDSEAEAAAVDMAAARLPRCDVDAQGFVSDFGDSATRVSDIDLRHLDLCNLR